MKTTKRNYDNLCVIGFVNCGILTIIGLYSTIASIDVLGNNCVVPEDPRFISYNGTHMFIGSVIVFILSLIVFIISCKKISR